MTASALRTEEADAVAAVMAVCGEPLERVQRAIDALSAQRDVDPFDVVIAAPAREHDALQTLHTSGAVRSLALVENPGGGRSEGLNEAVGAARAAIVVRVDARSVVRDDHVARCSARLLGAPTVGVVGGVQRPEAHSGSIRQRGIARALRNQWLLGNAAYRRTGAAGPTDTVYLGAFRRPELLGIGGYDEALDANEDFELCQRYRSTGRQVWLEHDLIVDYEPRASLREIVAQYRAFGAAKVRFWRRTGRRPNARQYIALAGAALGAVTVVASARRPARLAGIAAASVAAIAVADHLADPRERDVRVRAQAVLTNLAVVGGWLSGIGAELVRRKRATRA